MRPMDIVISSAGDIPIYQQLYDQLRGQIMRGALRSGEVLPPIRTVARELRISVITVKKAWEELEHDGLIVTIAGKGCFVSDLSREKLDDKKYGIICEKMAKDVEYYKSFGLTLQEIIAMIERCYSTGNN